MKKIYFLLLTLLSYAVQGQNYDYTVYHPSNSGIASANINDLKIDGQGNLWMATYDALTMFDGTTFTNYTQNNTGFQLSALQKLAIDGLSRSG